MSAMAGLICCGYSPSPVHWLSHRTQTQSQKIVPRISIPRTMNSSNALKRWEYGVKGSNFQRKEKGRLQVCWSSLKGRASDETASGKNEIGEKGDGVKDERDWTTSILLLGLWAGLMYYVFNLAPNQTSSRDMYFLQKLLNLKGADGFRMNEVLVSLWYILGLWPLVYSMLLLPSARSAKSKIPLWPFLILSFAGGAYALIPYFVLWRPPPPPVEEAEITRWPLNFLESKLTAWASLAAGLGLFIYAGLADGAVWNEFYQYFRESKLIHVSSVDFILFSTFAPFWVFNDMTARKWYDKGSWLLPISLLPIIGPLLYLVSRPTLPASASPSMLEKL